MEKTLAAIDDRRIKQAVRDVLREKLTENPRWLRDIVAEVLEDIALVSAIREGRKGKNVSRAEVFRILAGKE